jgi:hypothetical protein
MTLLFILRFPNGFFDHPDKYLNQKQNFIESLQDAIYPSIEELETLKTQQKYEVF